DPNPQFAIVPDTTARKSYSAVSPMAGLLFHLDDNKNLYLNYSRGYRSGGLTQISSDPSQPPLYAYNPEYSNSFELGVKTTFLNNRLRVNADVFYTRVNNAQVPSLILPEAFTVTRNVGKLTSKGFEAEISANPVKGLRIDYNAGFTDAVYNSLKVPQGGAEVDLKGNKQIFTPDVTSMLAVQYAYEVSKKQSVRLVLRGEWFYVGKKYFDLANVIYQSPYNLLNIRAGISTRYADIMFWKRNITNKKYVDFAYDFGAVHLAEPSTFGFTFSVSF
ncbi:MAG: TonB-dependent receptor, partial [Flavitalea sp.]